MSYMTMTMFAPRIWGFDFTTPEARVALQAGWHRADLIWEGLMEAGNTAWVADDLACARRLFRRSAWVARLGFASDDLRRATALVALAVVTSGRQDLLRRAARQWDRCAEGALARMQIAPRARSSLFHLRMEARHRQTYHDNMRLRLRRIAGEVRAAITALEADQPPACRLYSRWRGERPNVHDDTRKFLGACLLIPDPAPTRGTL